MLICAHCHQSFTNIRTARAHHIKCPNVKNSEHACRELTGCACDPCFAAPSQPIQILQMAPIIPPGDPDSASSESAFERATGYSKKAEKLFANKKLFTVKEMSEEEADSAWALMTQLQECAENCCSTAAIQVNRNRSDTGLKRKGFKPLRFFDFLQHDI